MERQLDPNKRIYDILLLINHYTTIRGDSSVFLKRIDFDSVWDFNEAIPVLFQLEKDKVISSYTPSISQKIENSVLSFIVHKKKLDSLIAKMNKHYNFGENEKNADQTVITKFPHKLPAGTNWENITMIFIDAEKVKIEVRGKNFEGRYSDMGFTDNRTGKPNTLWQLLYILAKNNGEITIQNPDANNMIKKQKSLLVAKLKEYFSIDYDPFFPYHAHNLEKPKNSYKIKVNIWVDQLAATDETISESLEDEIQDIMKKYQNNQYK